MAVRKTSLLKREAGKLLTAKIYINHNQLGEDIIKSKDPGLCLHEVCNRNTTQVREYNFVYTTQWC